MVNCPGAVAACSSRLANVTKAAELLRENPADQAGGAHAQHDAVAGCLVEQVEGLETLVDVVGRVDQLGYGLGTGLPDIPMEPADIPERALEIMGRQDESAARAGGKGCPNLLRIAFAGEVGILKIDELRSRLKGREENLQSRLLRISPGSALPLIAAGHNYRHGGPARFSGLRDESLRESPLSCRR